MEDKRQLVINLYKEGRTNPEIVKMLKMLKVNKMYVKRTLDRFKDTGDIQDHPCPGHPRTCWTPGVIKAVWEKIR